MPALAGLRFAPRPHVWRSKASMWNPFALKD